MLIDQRLRNSSSLEAFVYFISLDVLESGSLGHGNNVARAGVKGHVEVDGHLLFLGVMVARNVGASLHVGFLIDCVLR